MSVLIETTAGDIVIDLLVDYSPTLCENFLKLCKIKYYNFAPVHSIHKNFSFQTGDPLGPLSSASDGGTSIAGLLPGAKSTAKSFPVKLNPALKHAERGTVSMATVPLSDEDDAPRVAASQFIVTLGEETEFLDDKAAIFGKVVEGFDALEKINEAITDSAGHPLVDIRILHTMILDDPYPDPEGLDAIVPPDSPMPTPAQLATVRIASEDALKEDADLDEEAIEKRRREREARAQALTLEMMGDLPFADVKPPENVLFVCKLNPVTSSEDLQLIFSRFGKIVSCEVICDANTGDSLQYAFVEFEEKESCERAYFKMQDVLIDDRRIHVDFSQSVSKLSDAWRDGANKKRRQGRGGWGGVDNLERRGQYRNERESKSTYGLVHDERDLARAEEKESRGPQRRRSRSPRGFDDWSGRRDDRRDGDRDRDHRSRDHRDRHWDRDRDRDRHRHRDNRRDRAGPRDHEWDRDRTRDRH